MKCSMCGADNPAGQKYCGNCGAKLSPEADTEKPYFSMTALGTTTSFTRPAFYFYYGTLAVFWVFFIILSFVGAYITGEVEGIIIGVVMLLLSPVLYAVVDYRLRSYRRRVGKN